MSTKSETGEIRALTTDELNDVSGGVVCITHPIEPCAPVVSAIGTGGKGAGKVNKSSPSLF